MVRWRGGSGGGSVRYTTHALYMPNSASNTDTEKEIVESNRIGSFRGEIWDAISI